jgi:7,8-dihydropterin-6-yl-methyl-4-(beta-D-ribofuranosyl)aminobenzene 5'-phosphate synthase
MDLDADLIEAVIFFDGHSDNFRDPPSLLSATAKPPKIYVSATIPQELFQQDLQAEVVSVKKPISVLPGAWLLGPIQFNDDGDAMFEQVLVLDQPDGLVVIVSCDNPGIIPLVERVREVFGYRKIKVVAGGFHLQGTSKNEIREISLRLQQKGVKSLALSSCTGNAALKIFHQEWSGRIVSFDPGDTVGF